MLQVSSAGLRQLQLLVSRHWLDGVSGLGDLCLNGSLVDYSWLTRDSMIPHVRLYQGNICTGNISAMYVLLYLMPAYAESTSTIHIWYMQPVIFAYKHLSNHHICTSPHNCPALINESKESYRYVSVLFSGWKW